MKAYRGLLKLGRRLVTAWRRMFPQCRRRHPAHCLTAAVGTDFYSLSGRPKPFPAMTAMLFGWTRLLTRSFQHVTGGRGDDQKFAWPLLMEEEEGCRCEKPPPKGYLAVYVGGKKGDGEGAQPAQRYLVPVIYFNHHLFGELLREAEEEFGFQHPGCITIPCSASQFEHIRTRIAGGGVGREKLRWKSSKSQWT